MYVYGNNLWPNIGDNFFNNIVISAILKEVRTYQFFVAKTFQEEFSSILSFIKSHIINVF